MTNGSTVFAAGDFNGDGKLDLVTSGSSNGVAVYLGNGDGTFQAGNNFPAGGYPVNAAIGDFNGDGKLDLAVALQSVSKVSILLGNGDGTFQAAVTSTATMYAAGIAVSDFNGDGKADLVMWYQYSGGATILLGKGDGTFQSPATVTTTASTSSVTVADLDGDGVADLVVSSNYAIGALLGKGDGTFRAEQSFPGSNNLYVSSTFAGDFTGDGRIDILAASSNGVEVFPGNGDGTFGTALYLTTNSNSYPFVGDFDADGKLDVVLLGGYTYSPSYSSVIEILRGNGDGTFGTPAFFPVSSTYGLGVVGSFDSDGTLDLATTISGGYSIFLGGAAPDLTISASHGGGLTQGQQGAGYILTVNNGGDFGTLGPVGVVANLPANVTAIGMTGNGWTCTLATLACTRSDSLASGAAYPPIYVKFNIPPGVTGNLTSSFTVGGGSESNTANDYTSDTTLLRTPTSISINSSPNPSTLGQAVTLTANIASAATGRMEFYAGTALLGSAPINGGQSSFSTTLLPSGANSLRASYPGDSNYGPSLSPTRTQTVTVTSDTGAQPFTAYPVDASPYSLVSGDLNGDGKIDLVTANGAGTISVLLGNGNGTFRTSVRYSLGTNTGTPTGAIIADFNNDGKVDVVVVANGGLYFFSGNGDGTFGAVKTIVSVSSYYYTTYAGLAAADFDGDGNLDLATTNAGAPTLLLGKGDGTFLPATALIAGSSSYNVIYTLDINGDGKPDLIAAGNNTTVSVLLGNGDGTFQSTLNTTLSAGTPGGVAIGDFNGDGKMDLVVTSWANLQFLAGNGDGTFKAPVSNQLSATPGNFVAAGDFNGDGKLDIAFGAYSWGYMNLMFGNGDGTFKAGPSFQADSYSNAIVLGDFNGDGVPDFAAAGLNSSSVDVFLGLRINGLSVASSHVGRFVTGRSATYQITVTNLQFAANSGLVTVADTLPYGFTATSMTGTGWQCTVSPLSCTRSDGLSSTQSYAPITLVVNVSPSLAPSVVQNNVSVTTGGFINSSADNTTLVLPTNTSVSASPSPATLGAAVTLTATVTSGSTGSVLFLANSVPVGRAAISGNQATLVSRTLPAGRLSVAAVYSGDGTHGFNSSTPTLLTVAATPVSGYASANYTTGSGPQQVATGDFNNDGSLDLVVTNGNDNTVSILLGKGDGTFNPKIDYGVGARPTAVLVNDFNNDGFPDLAVLNSSSNNISILMNSGNGSFQSAVNYSTSSSSYLAATDFNGDGNVDLVVLSSYYNNLQVLTGNGDGTFRLTSPGSFYVAAAAIGDFNRDGKVDILVSNGMLLGNGDGSFQSTSLNGVSSGSPMITGDLNGDGKLDLVSLNYGSLYVSLGNGDGTFQSSTSYSVPSSSYVTLADINGDGKLDVVLSGGSTVATLLGKGDGTLQTATTLTATSNSSFAAAGDFNGDGRTDIVMTSPNGSNVTVLLGVLTPVFTITSTHADPFAVGQTGATYTITVKNAGPGVPSGLVTVTDALPAGFTATAASGNGWVCTVATPVSCTRSDSIPVGGTYSAITVTANINAAVGGVVINQVTVTGGGAVTANGYDTTSVTAPPTVIQTSPAGLQFTVDGGAPKTGTQNLNLAPGTHTIAVVSPQAGTPGTQYVFTGWSDSGAASHTITVGGTSTTYTASFKTQYQLTTVALPAPGGSLTAGGWMDAGTIATITATPTSPYVFTAWNGGSTTNPLQVTMNAPATVTAAFNVPGFSCSVSSGGNGTPSGADFQRIVNEALGVAAPNHDLNRDNTVNIADVQKVLQAALGTGCIY